MDRKEMFMIAILIIFILISCFTFMLISVYNFMTNIEKDLLFQKTKLEVVREGGYTNQTIEEERIKYNVMVINYKSNMRTFPNIIFGKYLGFDENKYELDIQNIVHYVRQ